MRLGARLQSGRRFKESVRSITNLYAQVLGQPLLLLRLGGLALLVMTAYQFAFSNLLNWLFPLEGLGASPIATDAGPTIFLVGLVAQALLLVWMGTIFSLRWHQHLLLSSTNRGFFNISLDRRGRLFATRSLAIIVSIFGAGVIYSFIALNFSVFFDGLLFGNITDASQARFDFRLSFQASGLSSPLSAVQLEGVSLLAQFPSIEIGLNVLFLLATLYAVGRWSLVFPAIALGFAMRIRDSWHETRGHGLRIMILMAAVSLPALIASEISVQIQPFGDLPPFMAAATTAVTQSLFFVITVALWSSAFAHVYNALGLPLHPQQAHMPSNA